MEIRELTSIPGGGPAALRSAGVRRVIIRGATLAELDAEARAAHPRECCGALFGKLAGDALRVHRARAAPNAAADTMSRYEIDARTVRAFDAAASAAGLAVVGYYHSHPGRGAEPSPTDLELALPGLTYLILSASPGTPCVARAWRMAEDRSRFEEQELHIE